MKNQIVVLFLFLLSNSVLLAQQHIEVIHTHEHFGVMNLYELNGHAMKRIDSFAVTLGKNGTGKTKEGDGKTPTGTFDITKLLAKSHVVTSMPFEKITANMHCVDDSKSPYYNRIIDSTQVTQDYKSFELMQREDGAYKYVLVVDYNKNFTPYKGSCIFIHLQTKPNAPTAGCIALKEEDMQTLLAWLKYEHNYPTLTIH